MKTLLILLCSFTLLRAETNTFKITSTSTNRSLTVTQFVQEATESYARNNRAALTNHINWLVDSGKFCEVRGHAWSFGPLQTTLLYEPNVASRRQCVNCKLTQTKRTGDWQ